MECIAIDRGITFDIIVFIVLSGKVFAIIVNAMRKQVKNTRSAATDSKSDDTVYCKIFSDQVSPHLCDIRRKELISQGTFSCENCSNTTGKSAQLRASCPLS